MGIQNFFKLVEPQPITIAAIGGSKVAIDGYTEIYRAGCAASYIKLTDGDGNATGHIKFLLNKLLMLRKNNIDMVFVIDGKAPVEKAAELARRAQQRDNAEQAGKLSFRVTQTVLADVRRLLELLGISVVYAPDGYDAEHVCADMNAKGKVDYVMTTDADVFAYGATRVIRTCTGGKYELYERQQYIDLLGGDYIVEASVALGTDFCPKVRGIGPKSVVSRICKIKYDVCHQTAMAVFRRPVTYSVVEYSKNLDELRAYLLSRGFNIDKIKLI